MRKHSRFQMFALMAALVVSAAAASAQSPEAARVPDMQAIAAALGVTCEFCHAAGRGNTMLTATGKPRLDVARDMIAMTAELNARVQGATAKSAASAVRVDCVTCHRGVSIPKQLRDIMLEATVQQGPEAAVTLYRDLRTRYYGRQSYDFGEQTLLDVADRLAQGRPAAAVALADLNIEFHPQSARSYLVRGIAQSRRLDTVEEAVASFRKVLELDPGNGVAQGWLIQTEQLTKRRP
jgi:hypothetical protein